MTGYLMMAYQNLWKKSPMVITWHVLTALAGMAAFVPATAAEGLH